MPVVEYFGIGFFYLGKKYTSLNRKVFWKQFYSAGVKSVCVQDFSEDRCYRAPLIFFENRVCSVVSVKICFSRSYKTILEAFPQR